MRRRSLGLAVAWILCATGVVADARQGPHAIRGQEKLQAWARLVHQHQPGVWDDAARAIAAWPLDNLRSTIVDLDALHGLLTRAGAGQKLVRYPEPAMDSRRPTGAFREIALDQVPALLGLADDGWSLKLGRASTTRNVPPGGTDFDVALRTLERQVTRFVKLAAVLHADVAILSPASGTLSALPAWEVPNSNIVILRDGQAVGVGAAPVHWELGRSALDIVAPRPAGDEFVRLWYFATSAYQEGGRSYAYAKAHLAHARVVLPGDAYMQFYSGVLQENMAAPPVQVGVRALEAAGRYRFNVVPIPEQLRQAEAWFRRALDLDPDLHEARVHLAHVVGLLGRHQEAARELASAVPGLRTDTARYYADLFMGGEARALGHLEDARAAFQHAHALCPRAQSPYLALSQLAFQQGDSAGALAMLSEVANLPAADGDRPDPWWTYDVSAFVEAPAWLDMLRAAAVKLRS